MPVVPLPFIRPSQAEPYRVCIPAIPVPTLSAITGGTCRSLTFHVAHQRGSTNVRKFLSQFHMQARCAARKPSSAYPVFIPLSGISRLLQNHSAFAVSTDIPECSLSRLKINVLSSSLHFHLPISELCSFRQICIFLIGRALAPAVA